MHGKYSHFNCSLCNNFILILHKKKVDRCDTGSTGDLYTSGAEPRHQQGFLDMDGQLVLGN